MNLRKPCEHGLFGPHWFDNESLPMFGWPAQGVCEGGTEPTLAELVEEVNKLRALSPAPYDIEIPDFVNRHGTW